MTIAIYYVNIGHKHYCHSAQQVLCHFLAMVEEEEGRYRRFINASFSTYRAIPRNIDALLIDDNQRTFLSALSSTFRKHLKRLAEDVSSAAELLSRDDTKNHLLPQLEREYDLLYVVEKSWHVCEIFTVSSNKMSMDLVRWLKVCGVQCLKQSIIG